MLALSASPVIKMKGIAAVGGFNDFKTALAERELHHFTQPFFVINDQNFFHRQARFKMQHESCLRALPDRPGKTGMHTAYLRSSRGM